MFRGAETTSSWGHQRGVYRHGGIVGMCCGEASVELGMTAFTHPHLHGSGPCHLRHSPWHVREFTESLLKCISCKALRLRPYKGST